MINDFYYDMLNLDENFTPLIHELEIFRITNQAHFIFPSMDKSHIIYQYNHKGIHAFDDPLYKTIHESSPVFFRSNLINYRILKDFSLSNLNNNSGVWIAATIYHSLSEDENDYCCLALFFVKTENIAYNIRDYINENYLIQTMLHVHMIVQNYETLSYSIDSFVEMISKKDSHMPYHMTNVASLCINIASKLNLDKATVNILYISALIHDIGKLFIPDRIINKPGPLNPLEFKNIKTHCAKCEDIAKTALFGMFLLKDIPQIIRSHHENFDGSGYPDKLKGEEIHILSRIIRVADSVDSMLSEFPYKKAFSRNDVITILHENSGSQFDPDIVDIMIEILNEDNTLDAHKLINQSQFFPKTMLSFFYKTQQSLITISGNLVVDSKGTRFIFHDDENKIDLLDIKYIHKATFSFFNQRILYEYNATISNRSDDCLNLKNILYIPSDKYFSLPWNSNIYIRQSSDLFYKASIINFGVETIIIETSIEISNFMISNFDSTINCLIAEIVDDIKLEMSIDLKIIKYYINDSNAIFICKYQNLSTLQKDKILKLLFRKQVVLRKSKNQIKSNSK